MIRPLRVVRTYPAGASAHVQILQGGPELYLIKTRRSGDVDYNLASAAGSLDVADAIARGFAAMLLREFWKLDVTVLFHNHR